MKQNPHSVSFVSGEASLFDQEGNRKYLNAEERLRFFQAVNRLECTRDKSFCLTGIKATPKGLRHSYAIACISASVSLPKLRKWMGHEDINTTTIYLDFVGEDDRELARKVWGLYDR